MDGRSDALVRLMAEYLDLGEAEYGLRSAVRSAADALGALRAGAGRRRRRGTAGSLPQALEFGGNTRFRDHAPTRALRVLENAAHVVDAIITVSSGLIPSGLQSSSEVQIASDVCGHSPVWCVGAG